MMQRILSGTGILPVRSESHRRNTGAAEAAAEIAFPKDLSPVTHWMESKTNHPCQNAIQFPPLPKGEGRGEGKGDATKSHPSQFHFSDHFRYTLFLFSLLFIALFAVAAMDPPSQPITLSPAQATKEGRELVNQMLSMQPEANAVTGIMAIRKDGSSKSYTEISIRFQTIVTSTNLINLYQANQSNKTQNITIVSTPGQPNIYFSGPNPFIPGSSVKSSRDTATTSLSGEAIFAPFAGSDFSIADLGLEFLHWPDQKLLQKEMKRSRSCRVLESTNPNPKSGGYFKVKCWVDNESLGILLARAFDAKGDMIKEFIPGDLSKSKATGQWQLGKMEIDNLKTDSSTTVRFDVDK